MSLIFCGCGCGEQREEFDKYNIRRKYIKGHSPNRGKSHTEESRKKMSESHLGVPLSQKHKNGISRGLLENTHLLGHIHSEKTKEKMSNSQMGKHSGEKCNFWKGGISTLDNLIRQSLQYKQWKRDIFKRDNWTCQKCGWFGGNLNAHHIKSFHQIIKDNNIVFLEESFICDELWDLNNGITLCMVCHRLTNNYGNKKRINRPCESGDCPYRFGTSPKDCVYPHRGCGEDYETK